MTNVLSQSVRIEVGQASLDGDLVIPESARGVVVFAHGSGSSRHSPRNRFVSDELNARGLGTLLMDLLTPDEEAIDMRTAELRFDIPLLAERLVGAIDWLTAGEDTQRFPVGTFGASTGAAAALIAAAERPERVAAVVSRGGRPDLAGDFLRRVNARTLFIVGERDPQVLELNRQAAELLVGARKLEIVPRATHLFEEAGALEQVAHLAGDWFITHLPEAGP